MLLAAFFACLAAITALGVIAAESIDRPRRAAERHAANQD